LLLDVPLEDLSKMFREVILVDVVHPLSAYMTAAYYRNVRLIRADVSATAAELAKIAKDPAAPLPRAAPKLFCEDPEVDYVASVNLLSQLPYIPSLYLERHPRSADEVNAYARELIESHLNYLRLLPGMVTLITDVEKLQLDPDGTVVDRFDILYGVDLPWQATEWIWEHVPLNHLSPDFAYHRRVCAVKDIRQAAASQL
jgi:hypothetical protein